MLEQSIIFQKGMGFARKPLRGHEYLEKARKKIPPNIPHPCRGLATDMPVRTDTKHTQHLPGNSPHAAALSMGFAQQGPICLGTKTLQLKSHQDSSADGTAWPCQRKSTLLFWLLPFL